MNLKNKHVLVVGAGVSGQAVSRFLLGKQAKVSLTDSRTQEQMGPLADELAAQGISLYLGENPVIDLGNYDLLVVSPGVPLTVPPVVQARQKGIPVIGELELSYHFTRSPIIAITGTNGKTTTTSLIGQMFRDAGYHTLIAGNIGLPLISEVEKYTAEDVVVAEVSSFQLETTAQFRPKVAVILNITPDHLDRHGSMAAYIEAKARIFAQQREGDWVVLNYDDPITRDLAGAAQDRVIFFSRQHILEKGSFIQGDKIMVNDGEGSRAIANTASLKIPGTHNLENALAAVAVGQAMGLAPADIAYTLSSFTGVAHRLEYVTTINDVAYINDSKGTNPDAAIKALEAYDVPIVLIAGGKNKGVSFKDFAQKIKEKVRVLITVGMHGYQIAEAAQEQGFTNIFNAQDYAQAVKIAHEQAKPGEVVLLSPACTSWDMFKNFEERGELFKRLVRELEER